MRILVLLPRFPYPPRRGDAIRAWTTLTGLAPRHEIWLACVDSRLPAREHLEFVRRKLHTVAVCPRCTVRRLCQGAACAIRGGSVTEGYFWSRELLQTLKGWSRQVGFDAVLTYSSAMAPAAEIVSADRRVLDLNDVDSHKWALYARQRAWPLSWLLAVEARRVAALEARAAAAHDVCLVVNDRERHKLLAALPGTPCAVVPTGVDLSDYSDPQVDAAAPGPVLGFVGSLCYPPNVAAVEWFGRRVWPILRRMVPQARWCIVGRSPTRRVRRWSRCPGVTVAADVPDVRPYLSALRVFVNPVDFELGIQTKLLMAFAAGRPAVVRPQTAAGLQYDEPPPFLVGDCPEEFAAAVTRLLRDDRLWHELSHRARQVAERFYSASRQVRLIEDWLTGRADAAGAPAAKPALQRVEV